MELYRSIVAMGAKTDTAALGALPLGLQTLRCFAILAVLVGLWKMGL